MREFNFIVMVAPKCHCLRKIFFFRNVWRIYSSNLEINNIYGHKSCAEDNRLTWLLFGQRAEGPLEAESSAPPCLWGVLILLHEQKQSGSPLFCQLTLL